jgi:uncharacterized damage-inducible protein DinB
MNAPEYWLRGAVAGIPPMLQPVAHVLDRLFTYAEGKVLSREQLAELATEDRPHPGAETVQQGLNRFNQQIDKALQQIERTSGALTEVRLVGRDRIPSTVIGLLFHAAEHAMRHTGQLLVTVRILRVGNHSGNRME